MAYITDDSLSGNRQGARTWTDEQSQAAAQESVALHHVDGAEWDDTISNFDGICHEQLHLFARGRWPDANCETVVFRRNDQPVAGASLLIKSFPLKLGGVAVSKWGPILKDHSSADAAHIYRQSVHALIAEYADKRGMMLSLLPKPARPTFHDTQEVLKELGFKKGPQIFHQPDRFLVDLRQTDDALRASFAQKWRYHLKKAHKADLEFERATPERFKQFEQLYRAMLRRKDFDDASAYDDTIDVLMNIDNPALRPEVFFVHHGEEIIAGALIFKAGETTEYLYGATTDQALPLRAGYFLQWHVIRWLRDNTEARWYDLGGTNGVQGLQQFKKGLVGKTGLIAPIPPVHNFASRLRPYVIGTTAFFARDLTSRLKRALKADAKTLES